MSCNCISNLISIADGEFYFSPGAKTAAQANQNGFVKFACLDQLATEVEVDIKEKTMSCRGRRRKVDKKNRLMTIKYKPTLAALGYNAATLLNFGDPDHDFGSEDPDNRQTALSAVAGQALAFDEANAGVAYKHGRSIQLKDANGNDVTDIEQLTLVGSQAQYGAALDNTDLVEGIDFELDKKLGMVTFNRDIANDTIIPTITSIEIDGNSVEFLKRIAPFKKSIYEGIARIYFFDDDDSSLFMKHIDFYCSLHPTTAPTAGEDYMTAEVEIEVLDTNLTSSLYVRPDKDFTDRVI